MMAETARIAAWSSFFLAGASATSALAGLLFVALSINLSKILDHPHLAQRAAETLMLLSAALFEALLVLVPGLSPPRLGLLVLGLGLPAWLVPATWQLRAIRLKRYHRRIYAYLHLILHHIATVPMVLAGLSLRGWLGGGLSWLAMGVAVSIAVALYAAWILLVEIVR